jgi:hypothetical protein
MYFPTPRGPFRSDHFRFTAGHPHDFASFDFRVVRGSTGNVEGASGDVGADSVPTSSVSGLGSVPGAYDRALDVKARATDGYATLTHLNRSAVVAFALAPATS